MEKVKEVSSIEDMMEILKKEGIEYTNTSNVGGFFKRNIEFTIGQINYKIIWFPNYCTLVIDGGSERNAQIPFMNMGLDTTAPIAPGGNRSLIFYSYMTDFFFGGENPIWESFRIPV